MKILSEFYFTNQLLQSDFNCENFYVNVKFEKKIYKINLIFLNFGPFNTLEDAEEYVERNWGHELTEAKMDTFHLSPAATTS